MSDETRETIDSPLDGVLRSLPEETPPPDLEGRILDATSKENAKVLRPRRPFRGWLPELLAAAAVVVLIVASQIPRAYMSGGRGPATVAGAVSPSTAPQAKTGASVDAGKATKAEVRYGGKGAEPQASAEGYARRAPKEEAMAPLPVGEEAKSAGASRRVEPEAIAAAAETAAPSAQERLATKSAPVGPPGGSAGYMGSTGPRLPGDFEAPEKPWRDDSGARQQVTSKKLELEVKNVEDAFDRSKSIIEKAHGIVESENLEVRYKQPSRAEITARVPLDQIDGTMAQLRELGKVLRLSGEAADVSQQYYGQGEQLRDMGQNESELVDKYMKETNAQRKQQLYNQIMAIREGYKRPKSAMQDLSEKTHSVLLELTLTGRAGPTEFLPKSGEWTGHAALWLLVTSVYWAPAAFIVWLVWRRAKLPGRAA